LASRGIVVLVLAAWGRIAAAQTADPDPSTPPESPDATPEVPTTSEPTPDATPDVPTTSEPTPDKPSDRAMILGLSFGFAGATGEPSDVYGPGYGLGLTLGYAIGKTAIELRLGAGYGAVPKYDALQGSRTRGSYDAYALLVRRSIVDGTVGVSLAAGIASVSVPLLSLTPDEIDPKTTVVSTSTVSGSGLAAGAAVHYSLGRHAELVGEVLGYAVLWELPGHDYVHPTSPDTGAMLLTYQRQTSDVSSIPWAVNVGIRLLIGT